MATKNRLTGRKKNMVEEQQGWAKDVSRRKIAGAASEAAVEARKKERESKEEKLAAYEGKFSTRTKKKLLKSGKKLVAGAEYVERKIKGRRVKTKKGYTRVGGLSKLSKKTDTSRLISKRQRAAKRTLGAFGATTLKLHDKKIQRGAGRPHGTYKYGMPIHLYNKQQTQKKVIMRQFQQSQIDRLRQRGLTPEQIQNLQLTRTIEERQQTQKAIPQDSRLLQAREAAGTADDELEYRKFLAAKTVSPNTQRMLMELRRVQNKSQQDNVEQQRRIFEKRLLAEQGNLLKARNLFGKDSNNLNILETEGNILTSPSVFKEDPNNSIMRTDRFNLMQTKEAGNNLQFF